MRSEEESRLGDWSVGDREQRWAGSSEDPGRWDCGILYVNGEISGKVVESPDSHLLE